MNTARAAFPEVHLSRAVARVMGTCSALIAENSPGRRARAAAAKVPVGKGKRAEAARLLRLSRAVQALGAPAVIEMPPLPPADDFKERWDWLSRGAVAAAWIASFLWHSGREDRAREVFQLAIPLAEAEEAARAEMFEVLTIAALKRARG